jgi:hypothetical protein
MPNRAYTIAIEDDDVIVRLRGGALDRAAVAKFLDYLELESIRRRSELSKEDAAALASEIDHAVWHGSRPPDV